MGCDQNVLELFITLQSCFAVFSYNNLSAYVKESKLGAAETCWLSQLPYSLLVSNTAVGKPTQQTVHYSTNQITKTHHQKVTTMKNMIHLIFYGLTAHRRTNKWNRNRKEKLKQKEDNHVEEEQTNVVKVFIKVNSEQRNKCTRRRY